jgi:DNA polymerase-3 subunit delta
LAVRLGRDRAREKKIAGKFISVEEVFDLWQADNEIKKLLAFAAGKEITEQDVKDLVPASEETDVLDVIDAIGQGDKAGALALIDKFLREEAGSDEKAKIIQLNALLSDQLRNVCLVQDFLSRRTGDGEILEKTSWKSGRLFVMKKISGKLNHKKILEALKRLEALDEELKSTSLPPRVPLNLIIMQLF